MSFTSVFVKMVELFLIIILGYIASKVGILKKDARAVLTRVVIMISMPAAILSSVLTSTTLPGPKDLVNLLLVAFLSYAILFVGAYVFPVLAFIKKKQVGIYQFMLAFGNVAFIGFPVTQAIFGEKCLFYTCVFNLPFNLLAYSLGVSMIVKSSDKEQEVVETKKGSKLRSLLLTPTMICSILAILYAFVQIDLPDMIGDTCSIVGSITTPAALLIIGSALADMTVKEMFSNPKIYLFTAVRLLVIPLITYGIFQLFVTDELALGVAVVTAGMPVATLGTMLCLQYDSDEKLMAQGTFISTLFSVVTIPFLCLFLFS